MKLKIAPLLLLTLILITVLVASITIGTAHISFLTAAKIMLAQIFSIEENWSMAQETIILSIRLPRVLLAALVGAALATAGCAMQGLLKNPMADPYIIGMSSGAALGAALSFTLHLPTPLLSFITATIAIFVVYHISKVGGRVPVATLLLSGIAVGSFLAALTSLIIYVAKSPHQIIFWLMGGLWTSDWPKVKIASLMIFAGIILLYRYSWNLNVMLLGEEQAQYLGVNTERVKRGVLVSSSLITAAAVSVSGIIGFVGLIIPHIMRIFTGPDHRILFPTSTLAGAIFLVVTDTISRTILAPIELPVGIITASFGAPFFIYLLRKRGKSIHA
ncbi:iron ABC transporter [Methanosarcinales archaeon ex4484_138]|nr:MAG: iron ABC transporter [Methanosarcinales archaeon ex4484_138]RLG26682.1 MAG: iron ABC transporter [Methanosarcinales archaeon]HHI30530.1 iron ABC transporter [Candidatus Methanoperedenaceae archaeon]